MKMKNTGHAALAMGLMLMGYSSAMAVEPVGSSFTYQGRLMQQNQLVDQPADLHFTLWDAEEDGNQLFVAVERDNWPIIDGLFTVELNFSPFVFVGQGRYLEIAVRTPAGEGEFVTLAPRQRLSPTPYAMGLSLPFRADHTSPLSMFNITNRGTGRALSVQVINPSNDAPALNAVTDGSGPAVRGTSDGVGVHGIHTSRGAATPGVFGESASTSGRGVFGLASADGGTTYGVWGESASTNGRGVLGRSTADSGPTSGVWGQSSSPDGRGVVGLAFASSGETSGVWGRTLSTAGRGVFGWATADSGTTYGVWGESASPFGRGVLGRATAVTGVTYGVRGESASTFGRGVFGWTSATSGSTVGVFGLSDSTGGRGVIGLATAGSGTTFGVRGTSDSTDGTGVWGLHSASSGTAPGVLGDTDSTSASAVGVHGRVNSASPGRFSAAVRGENLGTGGTGIGVWGSQEGGGWGVYGTTDSGRGVYGVATADSGTTYGVRGRVNSPNGWAGYFEGRGYFSEDVGIGTVAPGVRLHVGGGTDAELDGGGYLQLGLSSLRNVVFDNNEIMARDDGAASTLFLNNEGGDVVIAPQGTARVRVLEITGADLAEKFPMSDEPEPGMVVEIDPDRTGTLRIARGGAYNPRVAGVVSGANDLSVGAVLGNLPGLEDAPPIALSGRVWVQCDASSGAIVPGDLMTTSDTPGHAMKATDRARAYGATIGKAMSSLKDGRGLVLVLVSLQ